MCPEERGSEGQPAPHFADLGERQPGAQFCELVVNLANAEAEDIGEDLGMEFVDGDMGIALAPKMCDVQRQALTFGIRLCYCIVERIQGRKMAKEPSVLGFIDVSTSCQ